MLESRFVRPKSVASRSAVFILAKAPTYRMSINSEAPISTSQYYGNLYSRHSNMPSNSKNLNNFTVLNNSKSVLLTKSITSAAFKYLLRPRKSQLQKNTIGLVSRKIKIANLKNLDERYQSLLYVPTAVTYSLLSSYVPNSQPTAIAEGLVTRNKQYLGLHHAVNLKKKLITRRFFKKSQPRSTPNIAYKLMFVEETRLLSKNKKNIKAKSLKILYKKLNRFAR